MLVPVRDVINELWRAEIRAHWPRRSIAWRRELIRQYVMLLRLREDRRPGRICALYRESRESRGESILPAAVFTTT